MDAEGGDVCTIDVPLLIHSDEEHVNDYSKCHDHFNDYDDAGTTSFFKTCFNTINCLSGIGMLTVPYALLVGGWWSLIFLVGIALSTTYTGLLIKKCMDLCPDAKSYPDIGEYAFGRKGRFLVSLFVYVELFTGATGYLIMLGDNFYKLFPNAGLHIAGSWIEGEKMFIVLIALVILPIVLLRKMSVLSYVSASGVFASVIVIVSIFWIGAFNGVGFRENIEPISWIGLPRAISTYAGSYSAHPLFPTFYTSMLNQTQFPKVLKLSFLFCTFTSMLMAVMGCLMFGSDVQSQITLNLPIGIVSSKVAIYTTLVNPIAKYPLIITPIVDLIENRLPNSNEKTWRSLLVRVTVVSCTVLVALLFPSFIDLTAIAGAFIVVTTCSVIPCLCYLKISGVFKRLEYESVMIEGVLIVSILFAVIGASLVVEHLIFLHEIMFLGSLVRTQ